MTITSADSIESFQPRAREVAPGTRDGISVVVFTCGQIGLTAARMIEQVPGVSAVHVVRTPYRTPRRTGYRKIKHVYRYEGLRGIADGVVNRIRRNGHGAALVGQSEIDSNVLDFNDFHDQECLDAIRGLSPDLGVVVGTYILRPSVFNIPRLGSINLHTGKVPEYRGSAPVFWELYNGEEEVGITIHRVAESVDAGAVIRTHSLPLNPAPETEPLLYVQQYREEVLYPRALQVLASAVGDIANGRVEERAQDHSRARTRRMPTRQEKLKLERRVRQRRTAVSARRVKSFLGRVIFGLGLHRILLRGRAVVVLFHRVDDRYPDNPISCSTAEFEAYCRFFRRYFDVISMSDLADRLSKGQSLSGTLAITFDDGYADNVSAAEVMRRHGLTGCFYIATGYIGSDQDGWWDLEQGHRSRWMTWDEVRQLDRWKFELGPHTVTHIDLGQIEGDEAEDEIATSRAVLERETGRTSHHFAYPFGRRENITPANREAIRRAGFQTCVSAYGGTVSHRTDLFNIPRVPVSPWHRSVWQFGFELVWEHRRDA